MVLHGKDRLAGVAEAFKRVVIKVDMRGLAAPLAEAVGVNGEAVVLAGDFDFARAGVANRLVAAAVAEFQFIGGGTHGEAQELVAEADAEDWFFTDELFEGI